jgi:hypothetical protein
MKKKLLQLNLGLKALIFSDCEGYEIELFSTRVAETMRNHDFLIETHDFIRIDVTKGILERFRHTHECEVFESIDDILKAYNYDFPELGSFDLYERRRILGEGRPQIMRWVFAKARETLSEPGYGV